MNTGLSVVTHSILTLTFSVPFIFHLAVSVIFLFFSIFFMLAMYQTNEHNGIPSKKKKTSEEEWFQHHWEEQLQQSANNHPEISREPCTHFDSIVSEGEYLNAYNGRQSCTESQPASKISETIKKDEEISQANEGCNDRMKNSSDSKYRYPSIRRYRPHLSLETVSFTNLKTNNFDTISEHASVLELEKRNETDRSPNGLNHRTRNESSKPMSALAELNLRTFVAMIPHPDKLEKGGEDAYFISPDRKAIGIADGVGGWSLHGIDPAIFANSLMRNTLHAYEEYSSANAVDILDYAYRDTKSIQGSSTACIVLLKGCMLDCCNLGDSGFLLFRDGKILFRTKEQQHMFNFPFQLGTGHTTTAYSGQHIQLGVQEGDLLIVATDGLFDNLFDEEIASIISEFHQTTSEVSLAHVLASKAHQRASSLSEETPFMRRAYELGFISYPIGGKMDDITVIVAYVIASPSYNSTNELKVELETECEQNNDILTKNISVGDLRKQGISTAP